MRTHGDVRGYNAGAMLLHWAIAAAILFQIAIGFLFARTDAVEGAQRFALIQWHKTIGLSILALTLARIAWRLLNPPPADAGLTRAERALSGAVHAAFYVLLLVVPLTGWLLVSTSRTKVPTLLMMRESLPWPNLPVPASLAHLAHEVSENAHTILAYGFLALLALHVAGALKHSAIDRAPSFSRILPLGRLRRQPTAVAAVPLAILLVAGFFGLGLIAGRSADAPASAAATEQSPATPAASSGWIIDKGASKLGYETTFSGAPITGEVGAWDAAIAFDPDDLAAAKATITVQAASVTVADPFVRGNLAGEDGLDTAAHPQASVVLDRFEKTDAGFLAHGTMTVKGVSAPVDVPFTFTREADGSATVAGSATFDRLAYKLGVQNDGTGQFLGKDIKVVFTLKAKPATPS